MMSPSVAIKILELLDGPALVGSEPASTTGRYSAIFEVGRVYLIRTVTQFVVGRVAEVHDDAQMLILVDAAWIADTGPFSAAVLSSDALAEVEPVGRQIINIAAIVDATPVSYALPLERK